MLLLSVARTWRVRRPAHGAGQLRSIIMTDWWLQVVMHSVCESDSSGIGFLCSAIMEGG